MCPILSHIIAGRNDDYLGNFKYRLEMVVNYNCDNIAKSGNLDSYELLIVDWNSDSPLRNALNLNDAALQCTSFLEVTPDIIRDAGLPNVPFNPSVAPNVGHRRAKSRHILFTPADLLFPLASMTSLFSLLRGELYCPVGLDRCYFGLQRFFIPWQAAESLRPDNIDEYITLHTPYLYVDGNDNSRTGGEGGFLISREICQRLRGYDEDQSSWGYLDLDFGYRASQIVPIRKGVSWGIFCYDLQQSDVHRNTLNDRMAYKCGPFNLVANDENWGLGQYSFERVPAVRTVGVDNTPRKLSAREVYGHNVTPRRKARTLMRKALDTGILNNHVNTITKLIHPRSAKKHRWLWTNVSLIAMEAAMSSLPAPGVTGEEWFHIDANDREYFIQLYRRMLRTVALRPRNPIQSSPWKSIMIYPLLAMILTIKQQNPTTCLFTPAREYLPLCLAAILNPTLHIVSCDDALDWELPPKYDALHVPDKSFHGLYHVMTGPRETAFKRVAAVPNLPQKYQYAFLDVDYMEKALDALCGDLLGMLDDNCCIVLYGSKENRAAAVSHLPEAEFRQVGSLPGVVAFAREGRA